MTDHYLILMRHAKSSWDDLTMSDHDRPLNARGRRSASALGAWLQRQPYSPQEAIVSSAQRTVETFNRLELQITAQATEGLYHAGPELMMNNLQGAADPCVLMVGHNPGIAEFARRLLTRAPDHPRFDDYPTGATLVARFQIQNWREATWHRANIVDFVIPRDLEQ